MAVQQFCLRWNNHQPNFISVFTNLLSSESLVDVTLAAEGKQLHAHKVVLSACSTYFQALFTSNPCQHPIVILKDIKYNDLKTMVDFMYYGEVNVSQDQLPAILKTAETLKVKGLAEMPEQLSLSKSISQSSDKGDSPSPISPSVLRRKRLRKSSTGSGSEQTSEETAASGSGSTDIVPSSPIKHEPEEPTLRHEASTESETREGSHSFEEESYVRSNPSEETTESNIRWTSSEENRSSAISQVPPPQGWPYATDGQTQQMGLPPAADWPLFPRRKRSTNPQQDENFIAALEAVRTGGLGFCKAAKIYGVNNRTLWLEYKKRGYPITRPSTKSRSTLDHGCSVQKIKIPPLPSSQQTITQDNPPISAPFDYPLYNFSTL